MNWDENNLPSDQNSCSLPEKSLSPRVATKAVPGSFWPLPTAYFSGQDDLDPWRASYATKTDQVRNITSAETGAGSPLGEQPSLPTSVTLAELTTLQVGGPVTKFCPVYSQDEFVAAVKTADQAGEAVLVIGGGSNLIGAAAGFNGVVVQDRRSEIRVDLGSMCGGALVEATAGTPWDQFVCFCIDHDFMGVEALSGIPGTVGAAPVQNIGAYGAEVAETIYTVTVYDRLEQKISKIPGSDLQLEYRSSRIKKSTFDPQIGGGRIWGPTGRWVVLSVQFQLRHASLSAPIRYQQLADALGVALESRVDLRRLREAVLQVRSAKSMVLNPADPNSHSAGSFFTNPILSDEGAARLPAAAPRFPVVNTALRNPVTGKAPLVTGVQKTSAAWLINQAGWEPGQKLSPAATVGLSEHHVLAITNRGGGTTDQVVALAQAVQQTVAEKYQVTLEPEPIWVGNTPNPLLR